jgi:hypothetical protein
VAFDSVDHGVILRRRRDAGIVDEDVDPAELVDGRSTVAATSARHAGSASTARTRRPICRTERDVSSTVSAVAPWWFSTMSAPAPASISTAARSMPWLPPAKRPVSPVSWPAPADQPGLFVLPLPVLLRRREVALPSWRAHQWRVRAAIRPRFARHRPRQIHRPRQVQILGAGWASDSAFGSGRSRETHLAPSTSLGQAWAWPLTGSDVHPRSPVGDVRLTAACAWCREASM